MWSSWSGAEPAPALHSPVALCVGVAVGGAQLPAVARNPGTHRRHPPRPGQKPPLESPCVPERPGRTLTSAPGQHPVCFGKIS